MTLINQRQCQCPNKTLAATDKGSYYGQERQCLNEFTLDSSFSADGRSTSKRKLENTLIGEFTDVHE